MVDTSSQRYQVISAVYQVLVYPKINLPDDG